ncbi:hypothetical protein PAXRUDRAFT_135545, partial [Paxillus rubicundulus Ve08.2h10]
GLQSLVLKTWAHHIHLVVSLAKVWHTVQGQLSNTSEFSFVDIYGGTGSGST